MFYPELSPAMRWQLEQHQKMYSMYHSMESGKMALGDQYGEIEMDYFVDVCHCGSYYHACYLSPSYHQKKVFPRHKIPF